MRDLKQENPYLDRRSLLAAAGAGIAATLGPHAGLAGTLHRPLLGTPDQLAAERLLMRLGRDREVLELQRQLKSELLLSRIGRTEAGAATVDHAISEWTNSQTFNEIGIHRRRPTFLWGTDNTSRTWFGYTLPGVGMSGDNPDNVYRGAVVDGTRNYEILGWKDPHNPAEQLVIQIDKANMIDPASMFDMNSSMPSIAGATLALFSDRDLKTAPDGSFRITLGSGEQGPVHARLKPGQISVSTRDLLADWRQRPSKLIIREIGGAALHDSTTAEHLDHALIKQHLLADLPAYVRFWAHFPEMWFGGLKANTISSPRGRVGGWGFVAGVNYALSSDEAAIITTARGAARYTGIQICDPWMIQGDAKRNQVCLNSSQATPSSDDTYTYVISERDLGFANWLDTRGVNSGIGVLRWQNVPPTMTNEGLIREYRVVKLSELAGMEMLPRVTRQERRRRIEDRAHAYASRAA